MTNFKPSDEECERERLLKMEMTLGTVKDGVSDIAGTLKALVSLIHGEKGLPGLLVRLDRLEQREIAQRWALRVLGSGFVGLGFWLVRDFLTMVK